MVTHGPLPKAHPFRPNLAVEGRGGVPACCEGGSTRRAEGMGRQGRLGSQHRRVGRKRSTKKGKQERVIS